MLMMAVLFSGLGGNGVMAKVGTLASVEFPKPSAPAVKISRPRPKTNKVHRAVSPKTGGLPARPVESVLPLLALPTPPVATAIAYGAGQIGVGTGAGEKGDGIGGGGGEGGRDIEFIGGTIDDADYPIAAAARSGQGTVKTRIAVGVDGHAVQCRITGKSGDEDLDATTCRLILKRFRFRPASDAFGHAIADSVDYDQEWTLQSTVDEPVR